MSSGHQVDGGKWTCSQSEAQPCGWPPAPQATAPSPCTPSLPLASPCTVWLPALRPLLGAASPEPIRPALPFSAVWTVLGIPRAPCHGHPAVPQACSPCRRLHRASPTSGVPSAPPPGAFSASWAHAHRLLQACPGAPRPGFSGVFWTHRWVAPVPSLRPGEPPGPPSQRHPGPFHAFPRWVPNSHLLQERLSPPTEPPLGLLPGPASLRSVFSSLSRGSDSCSESLPPCPPLYPPPDPPCARGPCLPLARVQGSPPWPFPLLSLWAGMGGGGMLSKAKPSLCAPDCVPSSLSAPLLCCHLFSLQPSFPLGSES